MDTLTGHYAKWSKSDRQRQIPYDATYIQNLKKTPNEQKQKSNRLINQRTDVVREEGDGEMDKIGKGE